MRISDWSSDVCSSDLAPAFGLEQVVIEIAAAHTEHTAFASAVLFQDDRDVEAHQRADVACGKAVGANDVDDAPASGEAYRDLRHTRIARACGGIDLLDRKRPRLNSSHSCASRLPSPP